MELTWSLYIAIGINCFIIKTVVSAAVSNGLKDGVYREAVCSFILFSSPFILLDLIL